MNGSGSTKASAKRLGLVAAGLVCSALSLGSLARGAAARPDSEFSSILSEERNAVAVTADLRAAADRSGDRIRSTCAYQRLRGIMQALDSTQIAQVAWEGAKARGDEAAAAAELAKGQHALELVRGMRNEADQCVGGRELAHLEGTTSTTVTVETSVQDDDPNAGPTEAWAVRPPRLELTDRPLAASPFTPAS